MSNLPTSPQNRAALPDGWVDRLFLRLHAMYGKAWLDMWADAPIAVVKGQWSESLARFNAETIRLALAEIERDGKPFPPTLPEMVAMCEQFRPKSPPMLAIADGRRSRPVGGFESLKAILAKAKQ